MLTRKQILEQTTMKTQVVKVPEWGGDVTIKEWTTNERSAFEADCDFAGKKEASTQMVREKAIVHSVIDDKGKLMFTDADLTSLSQTSAAATDRVFAAVSKLNHISADDEKELAKNSSKAKP